MTIIDVPSYCDNHRLFAMSKQYILPLQAYISYYDNQILITMANIHLLLQQLTK